MKKSNLNQFVNATISNDEQSNLSGGLYIGPNMFNDDSLQIDVYGAGPYTTYWDGMNMGSDTM